MFVFSFIFSSSSFTNKKKEMLQQWDKEEKGYDCRKEGLMWVVYNLLELQVPLEYHHFPKYLTHEQIDYLKKYAKAQLKQDELKIIINTLKKKQNTQKMKDVLIEEFLTRQIYWIFHGPECGNVMKEKVMKDMFKVC